MEFPHVLHVFTSQPSFQYATYPPSDFTHCWNHHAWTLQLCPTTQPLLHYSPNQLPCPLSFIANQTSNCSFQGIADDLPRQLVAHSALYLSLVEPASALITYHGSHRQLRIPLVFHLSTFCTLSTETFTVSSPQQIHASYALYVPHLNIFAMNDMNITIPLLLFRL